MRGLHNMLLVFLLTILVEVSTSSEVVGLTYEKLEKALITDSNVETLHEHLYPINDHKKCIVSITYKFVLPEDNTSDIAKDNTSDIAKDNTSEIAKDNTSEIAEYLESNSGVCFHWLSSPVHLSTNDQLLQGLSLQTYIPETSSILLKVNLHNFSEADVNNIRDELKQIDNFHHNNSYSKLCDTKNKVLDALNNFTANAHMYAAGEKAPFHEEDPDDRGYSVYYYNPNISSKYCVLHRDNDYTVQRNLLNSGSVIVAIFAALAFPLLFMKLYKPLEDKLAPFSETPTSETPTSETPTSETPTSETPTSETPTSKTPTSGSEYWRYIIWSTVVVSLFVDILIIANDIRVSIKFIRQYDSLSFDSFVFMIIFAILTSLGWTLDLIGYIIVIKFVDDLQEDTTAHQIRALCTKIVDIFRCRCKISPKCIVTGFGYIILVHFLRLISFHVLYIMLGAVAAPSETLSVFCSYITAYVTAVIYVAIIFKYLHKENFSKHNRKKKLKIIFCCIIPLCLAGLMLLASIALYTAFFYKFNIVTEITTRDEGYWGAIKSFLPALLVAFLGFCGTKLLKHINITPANIQSDNGNSTQENTSAAEGGQDTTKPAAEGANSHHPPQHRNYGTADKTSIACDSYSSGSGEKQCLLS